MWKKWVYGGVMGMVMRICWGELRMGKKVGLVYLVEEMRRVNMKKFERVGWVVGEYVWGFVVLREWGWKVEKEYGRVEG